MEWNNIGRLAPIKIHPENPSTRKVDMVVCAIREGQIVGYPTDSLYAVGCDPGNKKAVLNLCRLKGIDPKKADLTFLCKDMGQAASLIKQIDRGMYKVIKKNVPGPFTFVVPASRDAPHFFRNRKKTVGIRIPDHVFLRSLLERLAVPILSTSLVKEEDLYELDIWSLTKTYGHEVDMFVDQGDLGSTASAIIEYDNGNITVLREGPLPLIT